LTVLEPWEKWESANLPAEVLDRIATIVNARNPVALRRRTFPTHPMDAALILTAAVFQVHLQRLRFDSPTRKQIKQIKEVAKIAEKLECSIQILEQPTLFRLENAYRQKLPLDGIHSLAEAARSASEQKKKDSHRPSRAFKNRGLHFLIEALYGLVVEQAEGELTLWQDSAGDLKGTLPAVLEVLRPYIPGLLPNKMHFSNLHRALVRAKEARSPRPSRKL
jgi:hypothetical protein